MAIADGSSDPSRRWRAGTLLARPDLSALAVIVACFAATGAHGQEAVELTGVHFFGHATSAFVPCATGRVYWLDTEGATAEILNRAHEGALYGQLLIVARGTADPAFDNGDFTGVFHVEELVRHGADADAVSGCLVQASSVGLERWPPDSHADGRGVDLSHVDDIPVADPAAREAVARLQQAALRDPRVSLVLGPVENALVDAEGNRVALRDPYFRAMHNDHIHISTRP